MISCGNYCQATDTMQNTFADKSVQLSAGDAVSELSVLVI